MIAASTARREKALAAAFASGKPFKHVVIDGFLAPGVCERLIAEFPPYEERFRRENAGKAEHPDLQKLGPAFRELDALLRSRDFLGFLERVTGVSGLVFDERYVGGGAHELLDGMDNSIHLDFTHLDGSGLRRRLNFFLYLNPGWRREWGGLLRLHSAPLTPRADETRSISPVVNRAVLFQSDERSWHSVSRLRLPPGERGRSRRSIAVYYYTKAATGSSVSKRPTLYANRLLPGRLPAGHVLTRADVEELSWLDLPSRFKPRYRLKAGDAAELKRLADVKTAALKLLHGAR